jgi:hypothetical protein
MSFIINLAYRQKIADSIAARRFAVNELVSKLELHFIAQSEQDGRKPIGGRYHADTHTAKHITIHIPEG